MTFKFKKLLAVGLMSLAAAGASQAAQLVVATDTAFVPFEFKQGDKYVGFDIDLWDAIAKELKLDYRLQPMDFNGILPALQTKNVDVALAGITIKDERKKVIDFSDKYYNTPPAIAVPKDSDIKGVTPEDLAGKTVGAQVGSKAADYAREHGANVKEFDTNTQGWMELEAGTCDAVSIDKAVAQYYLQQGGKDKLKIVGEPITSRGVAMGISKDKPELSKQVNEALKEIKADGTYAKIYKKWFGEEPKQ